jgi:hypothetical protein
MAMDGGSVVIEDRENCLEAPDPALIAIIAGGRWSSVLATRRLQDV